MGEARRSNRLVHEASPYLLQHAHNPVDWYPWGSEALERAAAEDKPILLSIGYAACHWCHVMERESFEDEETAALMNERFVSVKVDREERPDVDAIYMDAVQAMTGQGGWPLTAFLTPEGTPFYAGKYFPPEDRHGMPSFRSVLTAVAQVWSGRRDEAIEQGRRVAEAVGRAGALAGSPDPLTEELLRRAFEGIRQSYDATWGGFGSAPKFPQPTTLEFVLRRHVGGERNALDILTGTLDHMAAGGIYDHLGGGFHRYSVDRSWQVPHFEKMLYDNAQLARLFTRAWQVTGRDRYRRVACETLDYVLRQLRHPDGGFFSSQDADSESVEGRFYVWSYEELVSVCGEALAVCFGAVPQGNWEGTNVLWEPIPVAAVAAERDVSIEDLERRLESARRDLFELRELRSRPATDDKVITAWNAMAISALSEAGRVFGRTEYVDAAVRAAGFLFDNLRDERGLLRSWRDGRVGRPAFADDHALLAEACLTLYETTFDLRWFDEARGLADELLRRFRDEERGGFYQTSSDGEALLVRPKELFDNAMPSGNSAAAEVLLRMALLTGDLAYERAAVSALRLVRDHMAGTPQGFGHALSALDLYLSSAREVAIVGDPGDERARALIDEVTVKRFLPNKVLAVASPDDEAARVKVPLLRDRVARDGRATAYVCRGFVCDLPVTDPDAFAAQLTG